MKRFLTLSAFLAAAGLFVCARDAGATPVVVFDPPGVEFGFVEGDSVLSYSVMIRNEGNSMLEIRGVSTTCGCTIAVLPDSTVPPGGSVPLTGTFDTRKMEGDIHKAIFFGTNDPKRERAVLMLEVWVQRELTYAPHTVNFVNVPPGTETERTVLIRGAVNGSFTITGILAPPGMFRYAVVPGERREEFLLKLTLLPQPAGLRIRESIEVRTDVIGKETIEIPIRGNVSNNRR